MKPSDAPLFGPGVRRRLDLLQLGTRETRYGPIYRVDTYVT